MDIEKNNFVVKGDLVIIALRGVFLSLSKIEAVAFAKKIQKVSKLELPRVYQIVSFPITGLRILFSSSELQQFNKMLQSLSMQLTYEAGVRRRRTHYQNKKHELAQKAVEKITKGGLKKEYTILSLAEELDTNETTLKHAFKKVIGTTIYKFHQKWRMEIALEKIRSGKAIGSVAEEVGYSTIGHFSYAFKAYYGQSPENYRVVSTKI